ncbi:MAG: nucleotide sugar dehydrogenase, partial [Pseudomonadota bacterium]|nr:nucleotide sugar dehydrogenase [Pseudomonadota bacterium]
IDDFTKPDRIIIGIDDQSLKKVFRDLYRPFNRKHEKIHFMDVRSAELTKYAANSMLATKISFINELSNIAERVGADIDLVRKGIGADKRIGYDFLYPGCGYGGSCLPKDVDALINTAITNNYKPDLLSSVAKVNRKQKTLMFEKAKKFFKNKLKGKRISIWGLAFKPNTDDTRFAPSIDTIKLLIKEGAIINAYDPIATLKKEFCNIKDYTESKTALDAIKKSDALLIFTEWKEFWSINLNVFKKYMKKPVVFDGRNIYINENMKKHKIDYFSFGREAK